MAKSSLVLVVSVVSRILKAMHAQTYTQPMFTNDVAMQILSRHRVGKWLA